MTGVEDENYISTVKGNLSVWIANDFSVGGKEMFKLSDAKDAFPTIGTIWIEKSCDEMVADGTLDVPAIKSRIKIYKINFATLGAQSGSTSAIETGVTVSALNTLK